jgi:hypothetical protein
MALRTPYDFDKDPPGEYGEKLVAVADPLGAAPQGTYYFARHFNFTEGTYTFLVEADDAATLWLGTTQFDTRVIASAVLGQAARNDIYIQQGQFRLDVVLRNTPAALTPCYFTLVILRDGEVVYASSKDDWLLDDGSINDADLPQTDDIRFKLPVWSILPNWESGITERLVWQTDVMASETDAEQRRSVRRNARRTFEASFLRQRAQRARMDSFFVGVGSSQFMLPLWHEQVKMIDGIDMEATGVVLDALPMREFRKGDLVFVNNGDPSDYDILQVGELELGRFSWAFPPPRKWPVGTRIYPMRLARIESQAPKMSNITDTVSQAQVLFDLVEPYEIDASWGSIDNGEPLFHFAVDRVQALDVEFSRKSFALDNQASVPSVVDHGKYTTSTTSVRLRLFGRNAAYSYRQFLQAARGRSQTFMCPTFMADVYPLGDIAAGSDLLIEDQGFRAAMAVPQPVRIQLAFQFHDAPTLYRTITDAHALHSGLRTTGEKLTLDSPLPSIKLSDLKRISFLCETRFDQDQFEIHHPSSNQVVVDTALVLRQFTDKRTPQ